MRRSLAFACVLVAGGGVAAAAPAKLLGKTTRTPEPSCPKTPLRGGRQRHRVPDARRRRPRPVQGARGRLDRRLGGRPLRPNRSQNTFFADFYESGAFGTTPTARVSVLKRKDERNYKLKAQSPVVPLNAVLGTRQTFTLTNPLKIRKGEFLALTIPTWSPSFAVDLSGDGNVWRSSRARRRLLRHRQHQERQAASEGRLRALVRLRLQDRPAPLLGLLHPPLSARREPAPGRVIGRSCAEHTSLPASSPGLALAAQGVG